MGCPHDAGLICTTCYERGARDLERLATGRAGNDDRPPAGPATEPTGE